MLGNKLYFFYDVRFFERDGRYYSRYGVTDELMSRYAALFREVHYVARQEPVERISNPEKASELVKTRLHLFGDRYQDVTKVVRDSVSDADFCVLRLPSIAGEIGWRECKKAGKPYIIEVVGNIFEAMWYYNLKGKILALPLHLVMSHVVRKASHVAYITRTYLQQCYPTKGKSYAGIANVSLPETISDEAVTKRIEDYKKKEHFVIGMIGAVDVKYKGHADAIKALALVREEYPNVELRFLGQGNKKRCEDVASELQLSDSVFFDGVLPGGGPVFNWLDNIDIYVQPSYTEGHGRSVIEAQSRGCITITSDVGGMKDSLAKEFRFPKGQYKKLAELIIRVIKDKEWGEKNIHQGLQNARMFLSSVIEAKRAHAIEESYRELEA